MSGRAPFLGGEAGVTRRHAILRTSRRVGRDDEEIDDVPRDRTCKKKICYAELKSSSPYEESLAHTVSSPASPSHLADNTNSIDLDSNDFSPIRDRNCRIPVFIAHTSSPLCSSPPPLPTPRKPKRLAISHRSKDKIEKGLKREPAVVIEISSSPIAVRYARRAMVSRKSCVTLPQKKKQRTSAPPVKEKSNRIIVRKRSGHRHV